jgi:hypothetical protein
VKNIFNNFVALDWGWILGFCEWYFWEVPTMRLIAVTKTVQVKLHGTTTVDVTNTAVIDDVTFTSTSTSTSVATDKYEDHHHDSGSINHLHHQRLDNHNRRLNKNPSINNNNNNNNNTHPSQQQ